MSQDIRDLVTPACDLLAYGEPTHQEPAFGLIRNELFAQLADAGFRSIALETDRVAALTVNDFVRDGVGTIDKVMRVGFSHTFGELDQNRQLVAWMREYNERRPEEERLSCHGFDASTEMMNAPSPRTYLEYARDYLAVDLDLAELLGDDEKWHRTEAIMDAAQSPGDSPETERLRTIADDLLVTLHARAPELIAATSRAEWFRAKTHLTAGLGLLRYHRESARPGDTSLRVSRLSGVRDAIMAENLLDIRLAESGRGGTFVFAQNAHLQRHQSRWQVADLDFIWSSAGSIVASLLGERYRFVAGSLGRSAAIGLGEPDADTYEGALQTRVDTWALTTPDLAPARTRTDTEPRQGYFPLDQAMLESADALLHVRG